MTNPYAGYWTGCTARWWGPETNYGEFESGTETWNPFGRNVRYAPDPNLNVERVPDLGYQHPVGLEATQEQYRFTITFWVQDLDILPFAVGNGSDYLLKDAIASFHTQIVFGTADSGGTTLYHTYYGCKIESMELKVSWGNKLECTLTIVAATLVADFTSNPASSWTDETAQTGTVTQFDDTVVYIDPGGAEAEEAEVTEVSISFKNNFEEIGCVSGSTIRGLQPTQKEYTGSIVEIAEDNTRADNFIDQTALTTIRVHFSNFSAGHKNFWFHNVKFTGTIQPLAPGEITKLTLPFEAKETSSQKPVTFS